MNAWLPRALGVLASFITTKAAEKGLAMDPGTLISLGLLAYAGVHRIVSGVVNSDDKAKTPTK